ncbi:EamA family transporter [Inhella gelatinilytica]|uniref:EamA family transporter n=1 Tax=Inhella gelatinilytica TaxID=2795030 RepID=A0A931IXB3_9BURK|nr:EamA family transporter [Inhella gelatinilytica]MBH9551723.1 EamA family transporter [Inhella gelatinilytica]
MNADQLVLVLVAALLHAGWNIAAKRARSGTAGDPLVFQFLCGAAVLVLWAPAGLWLAWRDLAHWSAQAWLLTLASAVIHLAYFSALLTGYQRADLTVVYPVARGTGPLVSSLAAVLLLGEQPGPSGWLGIAVLILGVLMISGLTHRRRVTPAVLAGLRWGALTGALIASYTVVDAWAIKNAGVHPLLFDYLCNVLRLVLIVPLLWGRSTHHLRTSWQADRRAIGIIGLFSPLAYTLMLWSLQTAPLSVVAPLRECSMLFAALLGGHLLQEQDRGLRLAGTVCMGLGVALLASSPQPVG